MALQTPAASCRWVKFLLKHAGDDMLRLPRG